MSHSDGFIAPNKFLHRTHMCTFRFSWHFWGKLLVIWFPPWSQSELSRHHQIVTWLNIVNKRKIRGLKTHTARITLCRITVYLCPDMSYTNSVLVYQKELSENYILDCSGNQNKPFQTFNWYFKIAPFWVHLRLREAIDLVTFFWFVFFLNNLESKVPLAIMMKWSPPAPSCLTN